MLNIAKQQDIVECEDARINLGEDAFKNLPPLRSFRGNYGIPRLDSHTVVKGFFASTEQEANLVERLHTTYISALSEHLPVLASQSCRVGSHFYVRQEYLPSTTFEEFLCQPGTAAEKQRAYATILTQTIDALQKCSKTIGIDCKPENWMFRNGQWILIDTFPPLYSDENIRFGDVFFKRSFERQFAENPDRTYFRNLPKVARRLLLKSEKLTEVDFKSPTYAVMEQYAPEFVTVLRRTGGDK